MVDFFFNDFEVQIELSLQPCARQKLYFGDPRSHVTSKNTWFRARSVFTLNSHTSKFRASTLPNYLMMGG